MKKVIVFKKEEIEKEELDWEEDFKELVYKKLGVKKFKEVMSNWDVSGNYYVIIART